MKILGSIIVSLVLPLSVNGQKLKLITKEFMNSDVIREQYYVLKRKEFIKNGTYKLFHENSALKRVGQFDNNNRIGEWKEYDIHGDLKRIQVFENGRKVSDKKVGIWRQYLEGGEVITGFDYDSNMEIDTVIRVNVFYPGIEIENGIEGLVEISVDLDNDCKVMELKVIKSLSERCDEQALKAVRRMCELQKKYDKENCHKIEKIITIKFSLD